MDDTRLVPVPARLIELRDRVLLSDEGEVSPVRCVCQVMEAGVLQVYLYAVNGDWLRCSEDFPILRAEPTDGAT